MNDLQGRTFATWTLTSCLLCLICARNPTVPSIYGATLASFAIAMVHFMLELGAYRTLDARAAAAPLVIATVSSLWMAAGWNYYTRDAVHTLEATVSEEVTATAAANSKEE